MKYYHIVFSTPFGFGTLFYRGEEHPLMPNAYQQRTGSLASQCSLKMGNFVAPEAIAYISLHELPLEVAMARWPEDFKEDEVVYGASLGEESTTYPPTHFVPLPPPDLSVNGKPSC